MIFNKVSKLRGILPAAIILLGILGHLTQGVSVLAQDNDMAALKEKLMEAMKDALSISVALADYLTDNGYLPAQDGTYEASGKFVENLAPFYIKQLPMQDPWGGRYLVYCGTACNGKYGIKDCEKDDFIVICQGKDRTKEDWEYNYLNTQGGFFKLRSVADFDKDLVCMNGTWVRAPLPPERP